MGGRADKGRTLTRYLTGSTGIPFLTWNGVTVEAPAPYKFSVTTSRSIQNWAENVRAITGDQPHMAIRYDYNMDSVADAWVGMRLGAFVPLLTLHYNSISDRIEGE